MRKVGIYAMAVLAGLLFAVVFAYGQVLAKQYKTMAIGPYSVGVVCLTGTSPTVSRMEGSGVVLVTCPKPE